MLKSEQIKGVNIMTKKIISIFLCIAMIFALGIPAFAEESNGLPYEDSQFFTTGDYTIHYRVWDAENEKGQIFMIHGFALSSYCWVELAKILVDSGYTCVLADLPDFGYSTRETADMELLPREDIMHELMEYLSDDPWYVAGHSMGGYITLKLAEKYPDDVKNILLYGTAGNDGTSDMRTKMMTNKAFVGVMGPVMQLMGKIKPLVRLLLIFALWDAKYAFNYDVAEICNPYKIKGTGKGALYSFSMLPPTNYDAVKSFSPILFVNGSKDKVITDSWRVNLRAALPEGSVDYVVEGGGHMFIENCAEETAQVTLDFLTANK